jgi:thioredoxin 1
MAKEEVTKLSEAEFSKFINDKKAKLVVVDFFAEWCMPCVMMAPVLESTAENIAKEGVKFGKINVDEAPKVSMENKISSIPCIIFFKNGKEAGRSGPLSEDGLEEKIKSYL